jgi:hypothetical protein
MRTLSSTQYLACGQCSFLAFLIVSVAFRPEGICRSLSFYGTCRETAIIYILGMIIFSFCMVKASTVLSQEDGSKLVRNLLRIIAGLLLCSALTPHTLNSIVGAVHLFCSMIASDLMLFLSFWLTLKIRKDRANFTLLALQIVGGGIALHSLLNPLPWMLAGELVFEICFVLLITRSLRRAPSVGTIRSLAH